MEATETRILLERLLGQYVLCAGKVSLKSVGEGIQDSPIVSIASLSGSNHSV